MSCIILLGKCPNIIPTLLCKQKMLDLYISSLSKSMLYYNSSPKNKKPNGLTAKHKIKLKVFFTKIQSYYLLKFKVGLQDTVTMFISRRCANISSCIKKVFTSTFSSHSLNLVKFCSMNSAWN